MRLVSADTAVSEIASGDRVFVHTAAAAPQRLVAAMTERAPELRGVEVCHLHTEGDAPYADPAFRESFHVSAFFVGANVRGAVARGEADYIPVFLSEVPALFSRGVLPLDVALVQVSPPDAHGFCSLGVSVDASRAAVTARAARRRAGQPEHAADARRRVRPRGRDRVSASRSTTRSRSPRRPS